MQRLVRSLVGDPWHGLLIKLVAFSFFYGMIWINWFDLFSGSAPAYHLLLISMYFAPAYLVLIFKGWPSWELAAALGALTSLTNDLFYGIVGAYMFQLPFNVPQWLAAQLGAGGNNVIFTFEGADFQFPVTSYVMGASIYLRILFVAASLFYWWNKGSKTRH